MVAHNASVFLTPAVASIVGQSLSELEIVLVDNGSTDGSVERLQSTNTDPRLRITRLERNLGHAGGLLAGLPHCRGKFVAIMDADDLSLPNRLARQVDVLRTDESLDILGCAAATIDTHGQVKGREFALFDQAEIQKYSQFDMPFNFPTVLARRQVFETTPFRAETAPTHDLDWLNRALESRAAACLRDTLFHYRRHATSTTTRSPATLFATASAVRLAGARRRGGRAEGLPQLLEQKDRVMRDQATESAVFHQFGELALEEQLWLQAAWHARKAANHGGRWQGLRLLLATLARARGLPRPKAAELYRLALLGTIRAYRLHPQSAQS
jgi:hypothetical protein